MQLPIGKSSTTKDTIIQILSEEWPLTVKQIYERVQKKADKAITYQAVHKTLKQMFVEGVLEFSDKKYSVSKKWLKNNKLIYDALLHSYSVKEQPGSFVHLEFDSLIEFGKFLIHEYYIRWPNPDKKSAVCFWKHTLCSFGLSEESNAICRQLFAYTAHYAISPNKTFLDLWSGDYLIKLGKKVVCGVNYSAPNYTFIQGDYVMFAFLAPDFEIEFDNLYANTKKLGSDEANFYLTLVTKKTKIVCTIFQDETLADLWRKEATSIFDRNKESILKIKN
jgi:hypothetical protein